MWKQIYDLFVNFATLAQKMEKQEQAIKDLQRDLRELTAFVQRLASELQRTQDDLKNTAEREAYERKLFQLQIENQLLKAGRQLPPPGKDSGETER